MKESLNPAFAAVDAAPILKLWPETLLTSIPTCEKGFVQASNRQRSTILEDKQWTWGRLANCKVGQHCRDRAEFITCSSKVNMGTHTELVRFTLQSETVNTRGSCRESIATSPTVNVHSL